MFFLDMNEHNKVNYEKKIWIRRTDTQQATVKNNQTEIEKKIFFITELNEDKRYFSSCFFLMFTSFPTFPWVLPSGVNFFRWHFVSQR